MLDGGMQPVRTAGCSYILTADMYKNPKHVKRTQARDRGNMCTCNVMQMEAGSKPPGG